MAASKKAFASVVFFTLLSVRGFAALPAPLHGPEHGEACSDRLSSLYLEGRFLLPSSGEPMQLWVGKPGDPGAPSGEVWGVLGKAEGRSCEATCKVTHFERFKRDQKPALLEMQCEGTRIMTLRTPVHVQWIREKNGFRTVLRMGSRLLGMEQTPLRVEVNRYSVATK